MKHLLSLKDISPSGLGEILDLAATLKRSRNQPGQDKPLTGKTVAMIFGKSSTRTRVSFQVGIYELGGQSLFLDRNDLQLGRGETMSDTAEVLSRYVHCVIIRIHKHSNGH